MKSKTLVVAAISACALVLMICELHRLQTSRENDQLIAQFMAAKTAVDRFAAAERDRVLTCLAAEGHDLEASGQLPPSRSPDSMADLPDSLTRADAEQRGYSPPSTIEDPLRVALDALPAAERAAVHLALNGDESASRSSVIIAGTPVSASNEGCVATARASLYGSVGSFLTLAYGTMPAQIASQSAADDPSYLSALDDWARCMRDMNNEYDTPSAAMKDALTKSRSEEVSIASDDADCRTRSGVENAYATAANAAVRRWVLENRNAVEELYALSLSVEQRIHP